MAQEQRQQQATGLDDSLFYDKNNMPADLAPPVRGLLRRGWKCQADNARLEGGLWFPPWAKDSDTVTEANLHGFVMRPSKDKADADGNPLAEPQWEQLKMQDGTINGSVTVPILQTIITPAWKGVSFHEALAVERARAMEAQKNKPSDKQRLQPVGAA